MFPGTFSFLILFGGFIFQLRRWRKINKYLFWLSVAGILIYYFYLVGNQYAIWQSDPLTRFLLPPYESITYVFGHHFFRFGFYYLVSFLVALSFIFFAVFLNKKFEHRFFEEEEIYLGALAFLLLGNPAWNYAWAYYLVAVLFMALFGSLVISYWLKRSERFSFYWLWLPTALSVILLETFF